MSKWQPIETAPKDGTEILLYPQYVIGWWEFGDNEWMVMAIPLKEDGTIEHDWKEFRRWYCVYAYRGGGQPTHWMPLPEPPVINDDTTSLSVR
jgi:hypothetical protein